MKIGFDIKAYFNVISCRIVWKKNEKITNSRHSGYVIKPVTVITIKIGNNLAEQQTVIKLRPEMEVESLGDSI